MTGFQPDGLPALIGSFPISDYKAATDLVLDFTPDIPLWTQLPANEEEQMLAQFLPGLPGLTTNAEKTYINTEKNDFQSELIAFYEEYMAVTEDDTLLRDSRFSLSKETAAGFFEFLEQLGTRAALPVAVKGQITGPFTLATGICDQNDRAVFYDDRVRDAIVKLLALKARWQIKQLSAFGCPVIMFFDEPGLSGFGSSAFISISEEDIAACLNEVVDAVHEEGGLAGVHVCANTQWSLILDSDADIVSFDAYAYFDRFILYTGQIKSFMARGGILGWGIVPTLDSDALAKETCESLYQLWEKQAAQIQAMGIDRSLLIAQTLITPSCGAGALSPSLAVRALELTRDVSQKIRSNR